WMLATTLRGAIALRGKGGAQDVIPADVRDLRVLADIMNVQMTGAEVADSYDRAARHARAVTERVFFGWEQS
ncbi:MAG: hypothetical protein WDZ57_02635, partial [Demequina sp.]